jgi:elongation factor P
MLEYNEITVGKFIIFDKEPWEVLASHVFRKQQRKPVNATKLKNLITGRVTEYSFHQSEKAEEADLENKDIKFIYANPAKGEFWFNDASDASKRFALDVNQIGYGAQFMRKDTIAKALIFEEKIIGVKLPIKIELKVTEAPPSTKGNTSQGGSKQVKVETGAMINTPLFINEGETIIINTETGDYVERA